MTPGGNADSSPASPFEFSDGVLVMAADDAALVLHLLVTFERLLRHGDLTDEQLELLTAASTGSAEASADLQMAQVVSEAIDALASQLGEP